MAGEGGEADERRGRLRKGDDERAGSGDGVRDDREDEAELCASSGSILPGGERRDGGQTGRGGERVVDARRVATSLLLLRLTDPSSCPLESLLASIDTLCPTGGTSKSSPSRLRRLGLCPRPQCCRPRYQDARRRRAGTLSDAPPMGRSMGASVTRLQDRHLVHGAERCSSRRGRGRESGTASGNNDGNGLKVKRCEVARVTKRRRQRERRRRPLRVRPRSVEGKEGDPSTITDAPSRLDEARWRGQAGLCRVASGARS